MEALMGRAVRKAFPRYDTFAGVVESYDSDTGYFRVLYEDGDSEEVDADEMAQILVGRAMPSALQQLKHTLLLLFVLAHGSSSSPTRSSPVPSAASAPCAMSWSSPPAASTPSTHHHAPSPSPSGRSCSGST
jgi:hypothetical protein